MPKETSVFSVSLDKLFSGRIQFQSGDSSGWVMPWANNKKGVPLSAEFIARDVASFFPKLYNLNNPEVVFLITGSAQDFKKKEIEKKEIDFGSAVKSLLVRSVFSEAARLGAWVIDGGTAMGVMKLVGEASARMGRRDEVPLIGVLTWDGIEKKAESTATLLKQGSETTVCSDEYLDPNHPYFVFVRSNIKDGLYGADVPVVARLELELSPPNSAPMIFCFGGGPNSARQIAYFLRGHSGDRRSTVVAIEGTGGFADALAWVVSGLTDIRKKGASQDLDDRLKKHLSGLDLGTAYEKGLFTLEADTGDTKADTGDTKSSWLTDPVKKDLQECFEAWIKDIKELSEAAEDLPREWQQKVEKEEDKIISFNLSFFYIAAANLDGSRIKVVDVHDPLKLREVITTAQGLGPQELPQKEPPTKVTQDQKPPEQSQGQSEILQEPGASVSSSTAIAKLPPLVSKDIPSATVPRPQEVQKEPPTKDTRVEKPPEQSQGQPEVPQAQSEEPKGQPEVPRGRPEVPLKPGAAVPSSSPAVAKPLPPLPPQGNKDIPGATVPPPPPPADQTSPTDGNASRAAPSLPLDSKQSILPRRPDPHLIMDVNKAIENERGRAKASKLAVLENDAVESVLKVLDRDRSLGYPLSVVQIVSAGGRYALDSLKEQEFFKVWDTVKERTKKYTPGGDTALALLLSDPSEVNKRLADGIPTLFLDCKHPGSSKDQSQGALAGRNPSWESITMDTMKGSQKDVVPWYLLVRSVNRLFPSAVLSVGTPITPYSITEVLEHVRRRRRVIFVRGLSDGSDLGEVLCRVADKMEEDKNWTNTNVWNLFRTELGEAVTKTLGNLLYSLVEILVDGLSHKGRCIDPKHPHSKIIFVKAEDAAGTLWQEMVKSFEHECGFVANQDPNSFAFRDLRVPHLMAQGPSGWIKLRCVSCWTSKTNTEP